MEKIACMKFIIEVFENITLGGGILTDLLFRKAEEAGLYKKGDYGTPLSEALDICQNFKTVNDEDGKFLYHAFVLK